MRLIDFVFDGESLGDHRAAIGGISKANEEQSLGNVRTLNNVKIKDVNRLVNSTYEEPVTLEFDIISDPCSDVLRFTDEEVYGIHTWLNNKKGYRKFTPIYNDESFSNIYINGTFTTINAIKLGEDIVGLHLVFQGASPYFFMDYSIKRELSDGKKITFYNDSHEIGYTDFTSFVVECREAGNLVIMGDQEPDRTVTVNNVVANEVLTFDCVNETLTSSVDHERLYNDFNFNFPRLVRSGNDKSGTMNKIYLDETGIQSAKITATYAAVRKTGIIL